MKNTELENKIKETVKNFNIQYNTSFEFVTYFQEENDCLEFVFKAIEGGYTLRINADAKTSEIFHTEIE